MDYLDFKKIGLSSDFFWYQARKKMIGFILNKHNIKNALILEVGCGVGDQLKSLSINNNTVLGSDVNSEALAEATRAGFRVHYQNLEEEITEVEKYDVICAFDVLEHIKNDNLALKNIYNSLKKGGFFIFSVPAFQFLFSGHDIYMQHYRRYSARDIKQKLTVNNFKIQDLFYWNFIFFIPLIFKRLVFKKKKPDTDAANISKNLNRILFTILNFENKLIKKGIKFPFGVSIFGVAKK